MKSLESYKLYNINMPIRKWKSMNARRPFNMGSFSEMARDMSEDTDIDNQFLSNAMIELFNVVYENYWYPTSAFAGWPVADDFKKGCKRVRNNAIFWDTFYELGLQILEANPLSFPPLYPYQKDAYDAADVTKSGQIIMPVGSGKTWVQADVINDKVADEDGGKVIVLLTPRITLNTQQATEYFLRLMAHDNNPYRFMCNHSSHMQNNFLQNIAERNELEIPAYDFVSTTDPDRIKEQYDLAMENAENFVIVSTYHSANRIEEAIGDVDFVTCDEAHHVASNQFYVGADETGMNNVQIQNVFDCPYHYYTATPRTRPDGFGMDNHEVFGEVFHEVTPLELIEGGYIVSPAVYGVTADGDPNTDLYKSDMAALKDIWNNHYQDTDYTSKLLVQAKSRRQIEAMGRFVAENSNEFSGSPTVYRISTEDYGEADWGPYIDDRKVSKEDWISEVREEEGEAIIIHYDMLSEGLDVPGISGTAFFRSVGSTADPNDNQGIVKLVQTLGRTMRILPEDRNKEDIADYTKKKAFVYIPNLQDKDFKRENLTQTIVGIVDDMFQGNIPTEQLIEWGVTRNRGRGGTPSDVDIDGVQDLLGVAYLELTERRTRTIVDTQEDEDLFT